MALKRDFCIERFAELLCAVSGWWWPLSDCVLTQGTQDKVELDLKKSLRLKSVNLFCFNGMHKVFLTYIWLRCIKNFQSSGKIYIKKHTEQHKTSFFSLFLYLLFCKKIQFFSPWGFLTARHPHMQVSMSLTDKVIKADKHSVDFETPSCKVMAWRETVFSGFSYDVYVCNISK